MASKIKPAFIFTIWSPDDVAECMEGISTKDALYARLWELTEEVPPSMDAATREWCCADDSWSDRCLAKVWNKLTEEQQQHLNDCAKLMDEVKK